MTNLQTTSSQIDELLARPERQLKVVENDQIAAKTKAARKPSRPVTKTSAIESSTEGENSLTAAPFGKSGYKMEGDKIKTPAKTPEQVPAKTLAKIPAKTRSDSKTELREGRYGGHVITAEVSADSVRIVSWTLPEGKPAPKKFGLVDDTFKTAGEAGRAAFAATNKGDGIPASLDGRSLTFREPKPAKPAKTVPVLYD